MPSATSSSQASQASKKVSTSAVGAPAQLNQSSRKNKRAWRKNVDINDVEEGLEGLRTEERVTGSALQKKKDEELFQVDLIGARKDEELFEIDVKGDDQVRKSLPRFSHAQLTSSKILSQRSAVPAVFSRRAPSTAPSPSSKRKAAVTREDKARLLRIAKRARRGPFNTVLEPEKIVGEVTEAVSHSGGYDPWVVQEDVDVEEEQGLEGVKKRPVKAPALPHPRSLIELPAVEEPHQGTSYNPPLTAHQELLLKAHQLEMKRLEEEHALAQIEAKFGRARVTTVTDDDDVEAGVAPGMTVDDNNNNHDDDNAEAPASGEEAVPKPLPKRKTKQQRNKAARLKAEKRALAAKAARKRLLASLDSAKAVQRSAARASVLRAQARAQRLLSKLERLKGGLGGTKLGRHRVPEGGVDVQLGEDLSESLRGLKPEGNLFRDRLLSLQRRALVEPRGLVLAKRRARTKEYEKHAWKRFDREQ